MSDLYSSKDGVMNHRSIVLPFDINDSQSEEKVGQLGQFREQYVPVIIFLLSTNISILFLIWRQNSSQYSYIFLIEQL